MAFEDAVAAEVEKAFPDWPDAVAQQLGDAPETTRLTAQEELDMFAFEDSRYSDARALVQMGYTEEEATMMRFPLRMNAIRSGRPSLKEQVRAAKDLRNRYVEALGEGWEPPRGILKSSLATTAAQGEPAVAEAEAAAMMQQGVLPGMQQPMPGQPQAVPPQPMPMGV